MPRFRKPREEGACEPKRAMRAGYVFDASIIGIDKAHLAECSARTVNAGKASKE
jgi:hypothetical protein